MLKPVKYIELKNGQLMQQPDLCIGKPPAILDGFLLVSYSGKQIYLNKDQISGIEMVEQQQEPRYSFE